MFVIDFWVHPLWFLISPLSSTSSSRRIHGRSTLLVCTNNRGAVSRPRYPTTYTSVGVSAANQQQKSSSPTAPCTGPNPTNRILGEEGANLIGFAFGAADHLQPLVKYRNQIQPQWEKRTFFFELASPIKQMFGSRMNFYRKHARHT